MTSTDEEGIPEQLGLKKGFVVEGSHGKYEIVKTLGEGGFGAVFHVKHQEKNADYAMKVEPRAVRKHNKLKMEIDILKRVSLIRGGKHFVSIVDRGKKEELFVFLVMNLLGKSLADLKDTAIGRIFPLATGLGVGKQCLEGLEDLHKIGFIHRDLKPANYAIGLKDKQHVIYILDFGIARKIVKIEKDDEGKEREEIKTPRMKVNFKGTVRFASRNCHNNGDCGFSDDCESWFFLLLDLILEGGLPWKRMEDRKDVLHEKEDLPKSGRNRIVQKLQCHVQLLEILDYVYGNVYTTIINYEFIYKKLQQAAIACNVKLDDKYFWEQDQSATSHSK